MDGREEKGHGKGKSEQGHKVGNSTQVVLHSKGKVAFS